MVAALAFLLARPTLFANRTHWLDTTLLAILGYAWLGAVPLPAALVNTLTPASDAYHRAVGLLFDPTAARPLSLAPSATLDAALVLTTAMLLYWMVREAGGKHGARIIARTLVIVGPLAVVLGATHAVLFPSGKLYGFWEPQSITAQPLMPFISRNHFAAWMLVAAPIVGGYLITHGALHWRASSTRRTSVLALRDGWAMLVFGATAIIGGGVLMSQSRAGAIGLAAAATAGLIGGWRALGGRGRAVLAAAALVLAAGAIAVAHPENVLNRMGTTQQDDWGGRPQIWRLSSQLVQRYPLTGVGFGAFEGAMPYYQPEPRSPMINHAHNQYLEWVAEGGIIGGALGAGALLLGVLLFVQRLRHDESGFVGLRCGAAVGVLGLAVQSIWETPFLTPAVLWIVAVAAGLATIRPSSNPETRRAQPDDARATGADEHRTRRRHRASGARG